MLIGDPYVEATKGTRKTMIAFRLLATCSLIAIAGILDAQWAHDCTPYVPTAAGGNFDGEWSTPNEFDDWQFTVPADPGGGYATVTLTTTAPTIPALSIDNFPDTGGGTISTGSAVATADEQRIIDVFEVAAGESYNIRVNQYTAPPPAAHPVQYHIEWVYTGKADCYEPNDAQNIWPDPVAAARAIPLDEAIEAYGIAGYLDYFIGAGDANTYDWYSFNLAQPQTITIGTLVMPSDQGTGLRLFDQDGSQRLSTPAGLPPGETAHMGPELLEAGEWYIEVHPNPRGLAEVRPLAGEAVPAHFDDPYWMIVATTYSPSCGIAFIFCDTFESGDTSLWSLASP